MQLLPDTCASWRANIESWMSCDIRLLTPGALACEMPDSLTISRLLLCSSPNAFCMSAEHCFMSACLFIAARSAALEAGRKVPCHIRIFLGKCMYYWPEKDHVESREICLA